MAPNMAETITADYLVIGTGAMGMAFVDTILSDTKATVVMVDKYSRPGGHWTIAYPFVRLHQPSSCYGVNSRHLGEDKIDQAGLNKGMAELATGDEICAYFNIVMQQNFLPSGRVRYYPKHEYVGDGAWRSMVTGKDFRISKESKIVDATCMKVKVPAMMSSPAYEVSSDVSLVTPNDLTKITRPYGGYTVVGAGKTGVDSCLWLLANGVEPDKITWIMPRDSWFFVRECLQPGEAFAESTAANVAATNASIMLASSPDDFFTRMEASGQMARLTDRVEPTMFRCATVSLAELQQVKRIGNIVRHGRVVRLSTSEVLLEGGAYKPAADALYIDCTADGLAKIDPMPVFSGNRINLQSVRYCQQVFSAAFMAHVESEFSDEKFKNELCRPVPHPDYAVDYFTVVLQTHRNGLLWAAQPKTAEWLAQARLDFFGRLLPKAPADPMEAAEYHAALTAETEGLCRKLEQLISQLSEEKNTLRAKAQVAHRPMGAGMDGSLLSATELSNSSASQDVHHSRQAQQTGVVA